MDSAITVIDTRTSGRTSAARVPSARATITTSYSAARLAITCTMRGSRERANRSTRSSNATFCVLSSVAMGSIAEYSAWLAATCDARSPTLTRLLCPAAAMLRTVRAASSSAAREMSSE